MYVVYGICMHRPTTKLTVEDILSAINAFIMAVCFHNMLSFYITLVHTTEIAN